MFFGGKMQPPVWLPKKSVRLRKFLVGCMRDLLAKICLGGLGSQ